MGPGWVESSFVGLVFLSQGSRWYYPHFAITRWPPEGNTLTRDHDDASGWVGGVEVEMEVEKEEGGNKEAEQMPGQLKGPGECDECGQSVKPPLESQYYF